MVGSSAEHGLRGMLPQSAGVTLSRLAPQRREATLRNLTHRFRGQSLDSYLVARPGA